MANKVDLAGIAVGAGAACLFLGSFLLLRWLLPSLPGLGEDALWALPPLLAFALSAGVLWGRGKVAPAVAAGCLVLALLLPKTVLVPPAPKPLEERLMGPEVEAPPPGTTLFHYLMVYHVENITDGWDLPGLEVEVQWPRVGRRAACVPSSAEFFAIRILENFRWIRWGIYRPDGSPALESWLFENKEMRSFNTNRTLSLELEPSASLFGENTGPAVAYLSMGAHRPEGYIPLDSLNPGESVVLDAVFWVPTELENEVTLMAMGPWENEGGPALGYPPLNVLWSWGIKANDSMAMILERLEDNNWKLVEKYYGNWNKSDPGYGWLKRVF